MPTLIKPFRLSVLHQVMRDAPEHMLVVSALGLFDIGDEPGELHPESGIWLVASEMLGEGAVLDMAMPKAKGEVLLGGYGVAPSGKPVQALELAVRIGSVAKRVVAQGRRHWKSTAVGGVSMTAPEPFTTCPLDYSAAFGGPGFEHNPSGMGHAAREALERGEAPQLPFLEDPANLISTIDDLRKPTSFGQLDFGWPQRLQYLGTADAAWKAMRWPAYPTNMRREVFNAAAPDQWLNGFFKGDEPFKLGGMNAAEPVQTGRLPGLLARCFVKLAGTPEQPLREVPMQVDTVWLFGCVKKGIIIFRGVTPVADSDADDVSHIMVGYERMTDPRRDVGHYEHVFRKRTDEERGAEAMLADADLSPIIAAQELERRRQARLELGKKHTDDYQQMVDHQLAKAKQTEGAEQHWEALDAQLADASPGTQFSGPSSDIDLVIPAITPEDLKRMDFDIDAMLDANERIKTELAKKVAEGEALIAERKKTLDQALVDQGIDVDARKEAEQRAMVERQAGAGSPTPLAAMGADVDTFLAQLDLKELPEKARGDAGHAFATGVDQLDEGYRQARQNAPMAIQEALLPSVSVYFGQLIREGLAQGRDYKGYDLAGADLAGIDLAGRDLSGCFFERANLAGANLRGANLTDAVLSEANISKAYLSDAILCGANLAKVDGYGADLSRADLSGAKLSGAKLHDARLSSARMNDVHAIEAQFGGAQFDGAELCRAQLLQCHLDGINAEGADLTAALFLDAKLSRSNFRNATLKDAVFAMVTGDDCCFDDAMLDGFKACHKVSFARCTFRRVRATRSSFRTAVLERSSFEEAILDQADFGQAKLMRAMVNRASMVGAILVGADAQDALFQRTNLAEALCRKANFNGADLDGASLFRAFCDEATFDKARLLNTNTMWAGIKRS